MFSTILENLSSNSLFYGSLILLLSVLIAAYDWVKIKSSLRSNAPKLTRGNYPIVGAAGFFTKRYEFMMNGKHQSPSNNFSFFLGSDKHVVGLAGEKGREAFYESKQLSLSEGYKVLFGIAPKVPDTPKLKAGLDSDPEDTPTDGRQLINKRLIQLVHADQLKSVLPKLFKDIRAALDSLGTAGIMRPFDSVYKVIFQLTLRTVAADDIADSPQLMKNVLYYYEMLEGSSSSVGIVFPWLPTINWAKTTYAGAKLYMIFKKIIDERKKSGKKGKDPLQFMLDKGDTNMNIIEFVVAALFAGVVTSGINASYILSYLALDPHWSSIVRKEIAEVTARYSKDASKPPLEQLADIPYEAWESEFPMIGLCLKDSIRLHLLGTGFRRNTSGRDIIVGDEIIPHGAYAVYHFGDTHLDPTIYANPDQWDPSRYLPDRAEDLKLKKYTWNGFGAGRHPCLGMRFAKLEQNIIMAHYMTAFDFQMVDAQGQPSTAPLPAPNFNDHTLQKPKFSVHLKYQARNH